MEKITTEEIFKKLNEDIIKEKDDIKFIKQFEKAKNIRDIRKICKEKNICHSFSSKFHSIEILNNKYGYRLHKFYDEPNMIENLLLNPLKKIEQIEYLLNKKNFKKCVQEFKYLRNLWHTLDFTRREYKHWMGCRNNIFVSKIHEEINSKYYFRINNMMKNYLYDDPKLILPKYKKKFEKIYQLQDKMWEGIEIERDKKKRDEIKNTDYIIEKILDSLSKNI